MKPKSTRTLEALLVEAQGHYQRVMEMLRLLPPGWEEQEKLLEQESDLRGIIETLKGQIAARK